MAHIGLISAVQVSIIFRCHVSAAAPVFVADAKIVHLPRLLVSVFLPQICHWRNAFKGHIFYPFGHFLYGSASDVAVDIGFAAQLAAQLKKFVRTEAVVLRQRRPSAC